MKLLIGNKLYSSWSLRPWILLKAFDLPFEEVQIWLDKPDTKQSILAAAPNGNGKVPCLIDGECVVWESIAILDHMAEKFPDMAVWPRDRKARAHARSVAAEMHAGFQSIRAACPMNLGKSYAPRDRGEGVARDVARVTAIFREARERFGQLASGPYLYGAFSAADAMYAPMVTRLDTYGIELDPVSAAYAKAILSHPAFRAWREAALLETDILDHDEVDEPPVAVYRKSSELQP
jgi:glutathione S-transferase